MAECRSTIQLSLVGLLALAAGTSWTHADDSHPCPDGQHWDSNMNMCMPDSPGSQHVDFHLNQFLVGITESGPRGRTAFSAPNMFMLDFEQVISDCDSVRVQWMGTTDLWTVPSKGTPELLQTGEADRQGFPFIDAQHPHTSPIMGLTFAEAHCLGPDGDKKITFSFSPRGEATAGPMAFMHRNSAEGNPNAPLSHHLQDVFHIMSTVLATKFETGKWTMEGSIYSGREPSPTTVNLDMHPFDSAALRVERDLGHGLQAGASIANTLDAERPRKDADGNLINPAPFRQTAISAWLMSDNRFKRSSLSTSTIWGQSEEDRARLNSFLHELVYRFGEMQKNHLFSRFEVLQRTPEQLEVNVTGDARKPEWIKALTIGYERKLIDKDSYALFAGGSYTKSFVPTNFKVTYGGNPNSGEVHLRVQFMKSKSWN